MVVANTNVTRPLSSRGLKSSSRPSSSLAPCKLCYLKNICYTYIYECIFGIVTSSSQVLQSSVLQSSVASDNSISIDSVKAKPFLTSSRLDSDYSCDNEEATPHSHGNDVLLNNDSQITDNSDIPSKLETTTDTVPK